jgi:group I intron endonuclease
MINDNNIYGFIYILRNEINDFLYIGQTTNIEHRWLQYSKYQCKAQSKLYKALKTYGIDNFKLEVLETINNCMMAEDILNYWEKFYIKLFNTVKQGYNSQSGGYTHRKVINKDYIDKYTCLDNCIYFNGKRKRLTKEQVLWINSYDYNFDYSS